MTGRSIQEMSDEFAMLKDEALRRKKMGNQTLMIKGAEFYGENFEKVIWDNIHFYDCTFYGRTIVDTIRNTTFERCQFVGANFQSYGMSNVLFLKTNTVGETFLMAGNESQSVRFEECDFGGKDPEPNHFGAVGAYGGDTVFEKCTGQYMDVFGSGNSVIWRDCKFSNVKLESGDHNYTTKENTYTQTLLENVTCTGSTDMYNNNMSSLTLRNSHFEELDLSIGVELTGAFTMDHCTAALLAAKFTTVQKIRITNSSFTGMPYNGSFRSLDAITIDTDALLEVFIDNVKTVHNKRTVSSGDGAWLGAGTQSTVIQNSQIPVLSVAVPHVKKITLDHLKSDYLRFTKMQGDACSMDELQFIDTIVTETLDFTGAQVKKLDASGLARSATRKVITEGSNLRTNGTNVLL